MSRPNQSHPASTGVPAAAWFGLLAIAALGAYWPALRGEFLWDDDGHVTNPALQSWSGLARIWFEPGVTQQYYPLLHSAFWLEHRLWGDEPIGYHLINILLHAAAATLFGTLLRRLAVPGAWVAATLFLVHPVCVESVAWISEQKNTLSLVFYLAAALAYVRFDKSRTKGHYALASGLFICALLTKTVTASLPAALLVVTWWRQSRIDWRRDALPLLPWLTLGAAGGLFTAHLERVHIGAEGSHFALGFADRVVLAGRVFWFYLGKLGWPTDLTFVYPRWTIDATQWFQWLYVAAGLGLVAVLGWWSRRDRGPLAATLLFAGSLFPVLGFVNVYPFIFSYVADHFQYLASLGVFALAGALIHRLPRSPRTITVSLVVGALAALTWRQAGHYRDNVTLYETTLRQNPDAWLAHHNLAMIRLDRGDATAALPHIERTLALNPDFPEALNNLGNCLTALGRGNEALVPLQRAIQLRPKYAEAHNNLGVTLMALGRTGAGITAFENSVRLQPDYVSAVVNLAQALLGAKRTPDANVHFARAVELNPTDPCVRLQFGTALALQSRYAEALPHFEEALALNPESADIHLRLAMTLRALGRTADANHRYREAIRLNPALAR